MSPNEWTVLAARLQTEIAETETSQSTRETPPAADRAKERAVIANFLRREFGDEPPPDTATLPLFQGDE